MREKDRLRKRFLEKRKQFTGEFVDRISREITGKFFGLPEVKQATRIMLYYSYNNEIKTRRLIKNLLAEGKQIFLPYCLTETKQLGIAPVEDLKQDLQPGTMGIYEPRPGLRQGFAPERLDLIVVPGLIFSRKGWRIGYGGGYYDRFLGQLRSPVLTIGFVFHQFLREELPTAAHDITVDMIISEKEVIDLRPGTAGCSQNRVRGGRS